MCQAQSLLNTESALNVISDILGLTVTVAKPMGLTFNIF